MCENGIYEIDFKRELEAEINDMERVKDFVCYSMYFTMEEVNDFERYIKRQRQLVSYLK